MDQHINQTTSKFKRKIETLVDLAITKEDLAIAYTKILKEAFQIVNNSVTQTIINVILESGTGVSIKAARGTGVVSFHIIEAFGLPGRPKQPASVTYQFTILKQSVTVHSSNPLFNTRIDEIPDYESYAHILTKNMIKII